MTQYTHREASSFDFSHAPVYRKTALLEKKNVETAAEQQEVVTAIKGKEETKNTAHPGDKIITGGRGERYINRKADFPNLWEDDPSDASRYRSKNVIRTLPLTEDTELIAPWGQLQQVAKGGVVAQRVDTPTDIYLIEESAFKTDYAPLYLD